VADFFKVEDLRAANHKADPMVVGRWW